MSATAVIAATEPQLADLESIAGSRESDLVVQMAHDLRSPLSSILVLTEAMQSGQAGPVSDEQRHQLGIIYSAALCLCSAASDVVELARSGESLLDSQPHGLFVSKVLEDVRDMVQPMAVEKGLELRIAPLAHDCRVGCTRALSRVLLNLATNALKVTETGYVEIVAREVPGDPTHVEFSVRDSGPGLGVSELQQLYDPFPKATSGRRSFFSSSGLGLSIVRTLLSAMGSALQVQSSPRTGTRMFFQVDLPRATLAPAPVFSAVM